MAEQDVGELLIRIKADIAGLKASMEQAQSEAQEGSSKIGEAMQEVGKTIAEVFALDKIVEFVKGSVEAFTELDHAMNLLSDQLERNGIAWEEVKEKTEDYLESAEKVYKFDKEEMANSLSTLVRLTKDYESALTLNTMAMKFARIAHTDLASASQTLGLAYEGNSRGLMMMGRQLGLTKTQSQDATLVFAELERQTKGMGTAMNDSKMQMEGLGLVWENIKEDMGEALMPAQTIEFLHWLGTEGWQQVKLFGLAWMNTVTDLALRARELVSVWMDAAAIYVQMQTFQWKAAYKNAKDILAVHKETNDQIAETDKAYGNEVVAMYDKKIGKVRELSAAEISRRAKEKQAEEERLKAMKAEEAEREKFQAQMNAQLTQEEQFWKKMHSQTNTMGSLFKKMSKDHVALRREEFKTLEQWKSASKRMLEQLAEEAAQKAAAMQKFATDMGSAMSAAVSTAVVEMKKGQMSIQEIFEEMGKTIRKSIVHAIAGALEEWGVYHLAQAVAKAVTEDYGGAAKEAAAGGGLIVAAGAMEGAAEAWLAEGGVVDRPTRAVIGEAGPEAVIPLKDSKLSGLGKTNITINLPSVKNPLDFNAHSTRATISRTLLTEVDKMKRRSGSALRGF